MASNKLYCNLVKRLNIFFYMQQQNHCRAACSSAMAFKWDISQITSGIADKKFNYAILVLNRPVTQCPNFLLKFWNNASIRVAVDGGAVRWNSFTLSLPDDIQKTLKDPELVTGDFDSITDEMLKKYTKQGCKIVHTPDQNHTDFTKALMELENHCQTNKIELDHVVALAQASGRTDQILGNIQTLFIAKERKLLSANPKIFIMSDDSLSWLLLPGEHELSVPEEVRSGRKVWCSLVPVGESCTSVTTSGLKWDLDKRELKFGHLVSTSNAFSGSETVTIKCSHTILWSMKVPSLTSP